MLLSFAVLLKKLSVKMTVAFAVVPVIATSMASADAILTDRFAMRMKALPLPDGVIYDGEKHFMCQLTRLSQYQRLADIG